MEIDRSVRPDDARPAGKPDECFYCKAPFGSDHADTCGEIGFRVIEAAKVGELYPIEIYPEGHHALFWFPEGENGIGGFETGTAYRDKDGRITSAWSHGGPNSGHDFDFCEPATMWSRLPAAPKA